MTLKRAKNGHVEEAENIAEWVYETAWDRDAMSGLSGCAVLAGVICLPRMRIHTRLPPVKWSVLEYALPLLDLCQSRDSSVPQPC